MSMHFYPLRIKEIREETASCKSIVLDIPEGLKELFHFSAGQYLTVKSEKFGDQVRRSYSLCSGPDEGECRIAVKKIDGGQFSGFIHEELKAGDILHVLPPMGNFTPRYNRPGESEPSKKTYVLVAAGSGITPMMSIIKGVLKKEPNSDVVLIYGNRHKSSVIFKEQLYALKNKNMQRFSIYYVFTQEKMEAEILNGRINGAKIHYFLRHVLDPGSISEVFICGPEEMMHETKSAFIDGGIAPENVHVELFYSAESDRMDKKRQESERLMLEHKIEQIAAKSVKLQLDGRIMEFELAYPEQTLLDAALGNGADLPYACRGGVCATCKCILEEGEVEMDINYALEQDELDRGFILACQSHPLTDKVTISFDQK